MVGGHYTYAEVPLFDTLSEFLNQDRNNYDKLGHFAQGFIPAIVCREIIIRKNWMPESHPNKNNTGKENLGNQKIVAFFTICFCLAFSAFYELIEWWVAILSGENAGSEIRTLNRRSGFIPRCRRSRANDVCSAWTRANASVGVDRWCRVSFRLT